MALKTNYKDDAFSGERKYQMRNNSDGTVSFIDVTNYSQQGDVFSAGDINTTNSKVNEIESLVEGMGDRIVETGTSGIWTYEKRQSGVAVAWGKYVLSGYSWATWGSYGYETNNTALQAPPTGLFVDNPLVFPSIWDETGQVGAMVETWKYNNGSFLVRGVRFKASSAPKVVDLTIHVELRGRWK